MPGQRAHTDWRGIEPLEPRQLLATVSWDGGAGTNSWHDAANWSGDVLPGAGDDVVIDAGPASLTVVHSQNIVSFVRTITSTRGVSLSGGTIAPSVSWAQSGPFLMSGGTITGVGNVYVRAGMTWSGGTMTGAGRTIIDPSGVAKVTGTVTIAREVYVDGVLTWQDGNLRLDGGTLGVRPGGVLNAQSPGSAFAPAGASGTLGNNGTLRRNGATATTTTIAVPFSNTGAVQVVQGTLRLMGGGTSFAGTIDAGANRTVVFAQQTYVIKAASGIAGAGTFTFNSAEHSLAGAMAGVGALLIQGATVRVFGPNRAASAVTISGGVAEFNGVFDVTQAAAWSGGTIRGPGRLRIPGGGALAIFSPAEKYLGDGTIEVIGSATWSGGRLNLTDAVIQNRGVFTASAERLRALGGTALLDNFGTFRKVGGATLLLANLGTGAVFTNRSSGTVEIAGGGMTLLGGGTSTGAWTGSGSGSLVFGGLAYAIAGGSLTGVPTITIAGAVSWNAGSILGTGQLIVSPGATLTLGSGAAKVLGRTLANNGTVTWAGGALQLNGATILNAQGATLNIGQVGALTSIGGSTALTNFGTLNKTGPSAADFSASGVQFSNPGTLAVLGGSLVLDAARVTQIDGGTLTAGAWQVAGGTLDLVGATIIVNNAAVILGAGATFHALRLSQNNGTVTVTGGSFTLAANGAQFTNAGTVTMHAGATLTVQGKIILNGSSRLNVRIASASSFGKMVATDTIHTTGVATAEFSFSPAPGQMFQFISGTSRTGQFTGTSATGLPGGLTATVSYFTNAAAWTIT